MVLLLITVFVATFITVPVTVAESPKYGGVLRDISDAPPTSSIGWPPQLFGASTESPQLCFDGFLRSDNKGVYFPWLAESYKIADDYKSATFHLRKGVRFHDQRFECRGGQMES